jgi:uncharacterized membrane protein YczE
MSIRSAGWLLGPAGLGDHAVRRLASLYAGLVLFGLSVALMVNARLGVDPWDVLHQGIARRTGIPFGWVVNGTGVLVLLAWIPLRQRPGLGTVSNVIVVGLVAGVALPRLPQPGPLAGRAAFLAAGIVANAVATALYIGAGLGPGPRDGLMTGLAARGWPIRRVRTCIELTVLTVGWLLGGTVGVGTLLYAVSIGPLAHVLIPKLAIDKLASKNLDNSDNLDNKAASHDHADVRPQHPRLGRPRRRPRRAGSPRRGARLRFHLDRRSPVRR